MIPTPAPRSFSHVSLYVPNVKRAAAFFINDCGLGLPRERPSQRSAFLSTGGNHHEVEIFESDTETVSHLGLEYETEADLLAAIHLLEEARVAIRKRTVVPDLIRSVFCRDLDGNGLHLFANLSSDWTAWQRGAVTSETWTQDAVDTGDTTTKALDSIDVVRDAAAPRVAIGFGGGVLASRDANALATFYADVLGFRVVRGRGGDVAVLRGQRVNSALEIRQADDRSRLVELRFLIEGHQNAVLESGPADLSIRLFSAASNI